MAERKTWREKLEDSGDLPKVVPVSETGGKRWGNGLMVIPAPKEVDSLMRKVPEGKLTTIKDIRASLARKHEADWACPLTTGIFAWISAHAAEESRAGGAEDVTPYWRTLKASGELNPKYPGGAEATRALLEAEGHRVVPKGKRLVVEGFEKALVTF